MKFIKVTDKQADFVIEDTQKCVFFLENFSGKLSVDIQHEDAEVYIFGLYIGKGEDEFNVHTIQKHSVGKSVSDLYIKSVLYDSSKLTYEGLIRIEKGAQLSNAYQKNQNLVLSPQTFVDSRPFLEINANDVRCTHGSTTGKLSKDQLLYLQDRGLEKDTASELLVQGFITDLYNRMLDTGVTSETLSSLACFQSLQTPF